MLGKHVPVAMRKRNNRRIVGCVSVSVPPIVAGQQLIQLFLRQREIAGDVIFYAVCVISKESRRLVLPRTSYIIVLHEFFLRNVQVYVCVQRSRIYCCWCLRQVVLTLNYKKG
jgi:hypothetical protein